MKNRAEYICKSALDIEFEQDWSDGLGATLGDRQKIKKIFQLQGFFPGKADSAKLLGLEFAINLQNLMRIVGAIFEKIKI